MRMGMKPTRAAWRATGTPTGRTAAMAEAKKPLNRANAWAEARALIHANRWRLIAGLGLLLLNRAAGFVLPWSLQPLLDEVIPGRR